MSLVKTEITSLIWGLFSLEYLLVLSVNVAVSYGQHISFAKYVKEGGSIFIQKEHIMSLLLTSILLVTMFYNNKESPGRCCAKNGLSYSKETPSLETTNTIKSFTPKGDIIFIILNIIQIHPVTYIHIPRPLLCTHP